LYENDFREWRCSERTKHTMVLTRSGAGKERNSKTYWKIIGKNKGDFPYHLGVNSLAETGETFNAAPNCTPGGLYFTDIEHILEYLAYGDKMCQLTIPPDAQVVAVDTKFKADKIEILELQPLDIPFLVERGANIHTDDDYPLCYSAKNGHLPVVKFLVEHGANIHAGDDCPLRWSARNGHLPVVQFLVERGANIHADDDWPLRWSAENGHLSVVQFLVERGANIHASDDYPLCWSAANGHQAVVDYLKKVQ